MDRIKSIYYKSAVLKDVVEYMEKYLDRDRTIYKKHLEEYNAELEKSYGEVTITAELHNEEIHRLEQEIEICNDILESLNNWNF